MRALLASVFTSRARWGVIVSMLGALAYMWHFVNVSVDDVFISFRYADNLANGRGLVFNEGERVEGFTNLLWTLLLSIGSLAGLSQFEFGLLIFSKVLGVVCALLTLVVVSDLSRLVAGRRGAWMAPMVMAASAPFTFWAISGLESSLLVFLESLALNLHFRERGAHRARVPSSFAWVLACLTRPEPVVLFAVCQLDRWWALRAKRSTLSSALFRAEVIHLAWFVVPFIGLLAFRLGYYGEWVPNTYFAKVHASPRAPHFGLDYVSYGFEVLGGYYCVPLIVLGQALGRRLDSRVRLVWLLVLTRLVVVVGEGGDWMPALRFLAPVVPLVGILAHAGLVGWLGFGARRFDTLSSWPVWVVDPRWVSRLQGWLARAEVRSGIRHVRRLGALTLLVLLTLASARSYRAVNLAWFPSGYGGVWFDCYPHFSLARVMRDELHVTGTVATGEGGVIPYYTGLRLLDLNALMDKHLARQISGMHLKFDPDYTFGREPDAFVLPGYRDRTGGLSSDTEYTLRFLRDPRLASDYRLVREHEGTLLLYLRKPAP